MRGDKYGRNRDQRLDDHSFEVYRKGNFIGIDGGCAYGPGCEIPNGAIFLRLDDMEACPVSIS